METPRTPTAPTTPEAKLHFLDYWRIIRIRKAVILAVFMLVVVTTTIVTLLLPQSFSSTVRIEVGKDATDIAPLLMGVQNQTSFDPYFIQTEFEKIKSRRVLYQVITNLALTNTWAMKMKLGRVFVIAILLASTIGRTASSVRASVPHAHSGRMPAWRIVSA